MAHGKSSREGTRKQHGRSSAQPTGSAAPPPPQPSTGCAPPTSPLQFTGCTPPTPPLQFTGAVAPPPQQHLGAVAPPPPQHPGAVAPQYTAAPSPSPQYTAAPNPPPQVTTGAFGSADWSSPHSDLSPQGGMDPRPPGGFLNYLQSQQYAQLAQQFPPENFHFVGIPRHHAPFPPPAFQGSPSMTGPDSSTPSSVPHKQTKEHINLDADDNGEAARTDKRLAWTHQEDVRLVNAWIENSNDPINGNSKKNDHYWSQVADVYNRNTPSNRRREASQLKVRWHRVSTKINNFHGCYESVRSVYVSGRSDPEVIADALLKYEADYGEPFKLCHWWEVLKNEPKWLTYCERLKKDKNSSSPSIVIDAVQDIPRPEGSKAAKANRNGKRKMPEMADGMRDELDKFIAAQTAAREDREGMKEFQLRISSEKLEAAKLAQQAEKDKKERKILDTYKELMLADTSGLDEDEKAERKKALKFMSLQLFGGKN